jgi:hypothetical protein
MDDFAEDLDMIEEQRAERKAALARARAEQRARDIAALNDLEIEHGDENVASVDVARYSPGLPTMVVVRSLKPPELKRFRDTSRGENADTAAAAEQAGRSALLYPAKDSDEWKSLCAMMPGIVVRAGVAAVQLSAGIAEASGKG